MPTFVTCTTYSSVAPASAGPSPTTLTFFVILSSCRLPTTTTVGSGPVAGLPSPSVSRSGNSAVSTTAWFTITVPGGTPSLTRRSNCTMADCRRPTKCLARARQRRSQVRRAHVDARDERRHAAVGTAHGLSVQRHRVGDVRRVCGHRVAQHGLRDRQLAVVVDPDRVAQHVARVDDAGRHGIDLQRRRLVGVQPRHDRDGVRVLVVDDAHGAVGQGARVGGAARIRGGGVVPLRRAGHVRQRGCCTEYRRRAACGTRSRDVRLRRSPKRRVNALNVSSHVAPL